MCRRGEIKGRGWFFSSQTMEKPRRPGWRSLSATLPHRIFHTYGIVGPPIRPLQPDGEKTQRAGACPASWASTASLLMSLRIL
jgi:hypothetical protein